MFELTLIFTTALLVGLSGALMPGPLTAVTVEHALRRGYPAAPLVTLGHGLLEIVMITLLLLGLGNYLARPAVAGVIGIAGGLVLLWMGWGMIKSALKGNFSLAGSPGKEREGGSPFWSSLLATAGNPYWFLWWATVGAGYVALSRRSGLPGIFFFFGGHIMADFLWFSVLTLALISGKRWFTDRIYNYVIISLGIFLALFSFYFFHTGLTMLRG